MGDQRAESCQFVAVWIGTQLFGINLGLIDDVFKPEQYTLIPSAKPEIAGILNLRGRIIVAINAEELLGLPKSEKKIEKMKMVNVRHLSESYGLLVDSVGDVVAHSVADIKPNPINLDRNLANYSQGILRFEEELMVVLEADKLVADILTQDAA